MFPWIEHPSGPAARARAAAIPLLAATLACRLAAGQAPEPDPAAARVLILDPGEAGDGAGDTAARRAFRAQLGDLPVELSFVRAPEWPADAPGRVALVRRLSAEHGARLVLWLEADPAGDRVCLQLADPGPGSLLVRSVEDSGPGADRVEIAAIIARGLVEAILAGGSLGVEPTGAPPAAAQPGPAPDPAPPPPAPRPRFELGAGYNAIWYDRDPTFVHGGRLSLAFRVAGPVWLLAGYRVLAPVEASSPAVRLRLSHHPFELGAFARFSRAGVFLDLGAALVNDPLTWDVRPREEGIAPTDRSWRWLTGVEPALALGFAPTGTWRFQLRAGIDILFNEVRHQVARPAGDEIVIEPLPARPVFEAGAVFPL